MKRTRFISFGVVAVLAGATLSVAHADQGVETASYTGSDRASACEVAIGDAKEKVLAGASITNVTCTCDKADSSNSGLHFYDCIATVSWERKHKD